MQLSENQKKKILGFFLHLRNLHNIWNTLKKNWASQLISFLNYGLEKAEFFKNPKSHRVRTLMDSQHVKGKDTLLKSARQYFCYIFLSLWNKISSKNSFLHVS